MASLGKSPYSKTAWNVTARDGIVIGAGIFIGLGFMIIGPGSWLTKIILFAACVLISFVLAFYRVDKVFTLEQHLMRRMKYNQKAKAMRRGGGRVVKQEVYTVERPKDGEPMAQSPGAVLFSFPGRLAPKSNEELLFTAISMFVTTVFLAWVGTDGVDEIKLFFESLKYR